MVRSSGSIILVIILASTLLVSGCLSNDNGSGLIQSAPPVELEYDNQTNHITISYTYYGPISHKSQFESSFNYSYMILPEGIYDRSTIGDYFSGIKTPIDRGPIVVIESDSIISYLDIEPKGLINTGDGLYIATESLDQSTNYEFFLIYSGPEDVLPWGGQYAGHAIIDN